VYSLVRLSRIIDFFIEYRPFLSKLTTCYVECVDGYSELFLPNNGHFSELSSLGPSIFTHKNCWTVHFGNFKQSILIYLSTFILADRSPSLLKIFRPSTLALLDQSEVKWTYTSTHNRPLWPKRPSTIVLGRPLWFKWPSSLAQDRSIFVGPST